MSDVTKTNDHASNCKSFAVSLGYYQDPYVRFFARNPERKPPEISLGTYVRVMIVRLVITEFISLFKRKCNIVSLGAGFDTLFWNLPQKPLKYVEVDLKDVVMRKCLIIERTPPLKQNLPKDAKIAPTGISSDGFYLITADISNPDEALTLILDKSQLDCTLPTLFLSECVLVYLPSRLSQKLVDSIASKFAKAAFLLYEQVNVGDRFGQIMIENMRSTWCSEIGEDACSSLASQENRFEGSWKFARARLTSQLSTKLPGYSSAHSIEKLDEEELLQQLLTHYCFLFASNDEALLNSESELNYIKEFFF